MPNTYLTIDLAKSATDDERLVIGIASTPEPDGQSGVWEGRPYAGDIIDPAAMRDALADYMQYANVREMHRNQAAGTVERAEQTADGATRIAVRVVDDDAWKKVKAGVYKGFSIGGKALRAQLEKLPDGRVVRRILKLLLTEISLVDRPANAGARILVFKRDGGDMPDDETTTAGQDTDAVTTLRTLATPAAIYAAALAKAAAPDPTKIVALIQTARNELELAGDIEGSGLLTQAINLVQQVIGNAEAVDTEEAAVDEADDAELLADDDLTAAELMAAAKAQLRKSSRLRMGKRLPGLEAIAKSLLQLAADAGSASAIRALAAYSGDTAEPVDMKAIGAELQKALQPFAAGIVAIYDLQSRVPTTGGPLSRVTPITKALGNEPPPVVTTPDAQTVARLRQLAVTETHPGRREQYRAELAKLAGD